MTILPAFSPARALSCALGLLLFGPVPAARSQDEAVEAPRIAEVRLDGPRVLPEATLRAALRTRPNRRFLGLPGATWWLWLYQSGQRAGLGRLGDALQTLGEPPAVVDPSVVAADADRLALLLQQEGYRRARVTAALDTLSGRRVRVRFHLSPGPAARWRRVLYAVETPERADSLVRGSLLQPAGPLRADTLHGYAGLAVRPRADRYSETLLVEERRRLVSALRQHGYAAATRDSVRALVFPVTDAEGDAFDLVLRVRPGPRFYFGGINARVAGPEPDAPPRAYAEGRPPLEVVVTQHGERRLDPHLVTRRLVAEPGALYRESDLLGTRRRLDATGVFSFVDVVPAWRDTFRAGGVAYLPHRLELRTRARHSLRAETFAQQRLGAAPLGGSEGAQLGTGLALAYENANLLGRGEALRVRLSGQVSTDPEENLFGSREAELSVSLTAPYAVGPLGGLERLAALGARTQGALSALTAVRNELLLVLRSRITGRVSVELQHTPHLRSVVDGLDLSLSNPDTLAGFRRQFLDRLTGDPLGPERERLLEDYTRPQVSASARYRLQYLDAHPLRRDSGWAAEVSIAGGGLVETLLDRLVVTPDTLEEQLPAPGGGSLFYRPYLRFTGDVRRYRAFEGRVVVALRGSAGVAFALGRSGLVPFDARFFAGGGTSVRGWGLRELGPGGAFAQRGEVVNVSGADVRLEAAAEVRYAFMSTFLGADWIAVAFADAGNVWYGPRNPGLVQNAPRPRTGRFRVPDFVAQTALGTGTGLRLAWPFIVVRLDAAVRARDPAKRGLFYDGLMPTLHFGLGHAF